jgi:hypothetical protein
LQGRCSVRSQQKGERDGEDESSSHGEQQKTYRWRQPRSKTQKRTSTPSRRK